MDDQRPARRKSRNRLTRQRDDYQYPSGGRSTAADDGAYQILELL